jgi:hypothetical protein
MYDGYFEMGGNEILNRERAYTYAREAGCPITWLRLAGCPGLDDALGDQPYTNGVTEAPWYDGALPETGRFYGAYPLTIEGISDSTRIATITEGILDGGVIQGGRRAVRQVRCTALLVAEGMDALEAGMSWLDEALDLENCSTHAGTCGEVDACFFVSCPPERIDGESDDDYEEDIRLLRRQMHGCVTISGPLITGTLKRGEHYGYLVEFTVAAATPWVFSMPEQIDLIPSPATVVQDSPFNLVTYPSAELADAANLTVATNLSTNPSVETNTTGWTGTVTVVSGSDPTSLITSAQSNDIAAVGTYSYRRRLLGNSTNLSGTATITIYQDVALASNTRVSVTIWGALLLLAGATSTLNSLSAQVVWLTSGGVTVSTTSLGSALSSELGGRVFSVDSAAVPATAVTARVMLSAGVSWVSSTTPANNCDIRFYGDALAVTVP